MMILALVLGAVAGGVTTQFIGDYRVALAVGIVVAVWALRQPVEDGQQGIVIMQQPEPQRRRWFG